MTDDEALGVFEFTNTGDEAVTIDKITTSCGCTAAELEKKAYAPGESGRINARFTFGDRNGQHNIRIAVFTPESYPRRTTLWLHVKIPILVHARPRMVFWKDGEAPEEKTIDIKIVHDEPFRLVEALSSDDRVEARLEELKKRKHYRLHVKPRVVGERVVSRIELRSDYPEDTPKSYNVYARVAGPKPPDEADETAPKEEAPKTPPADDAKRTEDERS